MLTPEQLKDKIERIQSEGVGGVLTVSHDATDKQIELLKRMYNGAIVIKED